MCRCAYPQEMLVDPFEEQFISPFLSDCASLMLGIACIPHSQAMLERGVCELAHSFFHSPFEKRWSLVRRKDHPHRRYQVWWGWWLWWMVPQYAGEWPQIGIVRSEEENTVEVHWYGGRKSSTWKPCKKQCQGVEEEKRTGLKSYLQHVLQLRLS